MKENLGEIPKESLEVIPDGKLGEQGSGIIHNKIPEKVNSEMEFLMEAP